MAGQCWAKYEIPVDAAVSFRNWVVTHVSGKELPDSSNPPGIPARIPVTDPQVGKPASGDSARVIDRG